MARFTVEPDELRAASARVSTSGTDVDAAGAAVWASSAALAWTPVAGAYEDLVDSIAVSLRNLAEAPSQLAVALTTAATAYQVADESATASMTLNRG
jgi:uncharacterized protein YukE